MKNIFLIFISLCLLVAGCNKEDDLDQGFLVYRESGCANPWGATKEINKIKEFLESEGLQILAIKREENSKYSEFQPCEACTCLTGAAILIIVDDNDAFKAFSLGFTTING